jgi:hypothetical protein
MDLEQEASRATELLAGRTVRAVYRHRPGEVVVMFTDGTRLFVDGRPDSTIELSITDP